jgi:hypothetical protein
MEEQQGQKRGREEAEDAPLLKRDGDAVYVELGGPTKRITVSKYKNTMLVHIREYYEVRNFVVLLDVVCSCLFGCFSACVTERRRNAAGKVWNRAHLGQVCRAQESAPCH